MLWSKLSIIPLGESVSQSNTTRKERSWDIYPTSYQSLVKDALWGAWSSKRAEHHTLVSWNNFGRIKADWLKITYCMWQERSCAVQIPVQCGDEGGNTVSWQPPVVSPSGSILAFQPGSHYSQGGPPSVADQGHLCPMWDSLKGKAQAAVWWLHLPNLVSSLFLSLNPFAFLTPSQLLLLWEPNLWLYFMESKTSLLNAIEQGKTTPIKTWHINGW